MHLKYRCLQNDGVKPLHEPVVTYSVNWDPKNMLFLFKKMRLEILFAFV